MNTLPAVKKIVLCAVCIALCAALPMAFHFVPNAGVVISPMHIPVLLCGLLCGGSLGLVCGLLGPLLSSVLTGMPSMAILPAMMLELAVYGLASGLLMRLARTGKLHYDLYISLVVAMLAGRVVAGVARALIFSPGGYTIAAWAATYFATALPGIVIQLLFIPAVYLALVKAGIVPARYPKR